MHVQSAVVSSSFFRGSKSQEFWDVESNSRKAVEEKQDAIVLGLSLFS
jgi:hypothetical protein